MNKINRNEIIEDLKLLAKKHEENSIQNKDALLQEYYKGNVVTLSLHENIMNNLAYNDLCILEGKDTIYIERHGEVLFATHHTMFKELLKTLELVNMHFLKGTENLAFMVNGRAYNINTEKVFNDLIDDLNTILFYTSKNFYMIEEEVSDKNLSKLYSTVTENLSLF